MHLWRPAAHVARVQVDPARAWHRALGCRAGAFVLRPGLVFGGFGGIRICLVLDGAAGAGVAFALSWPGRRITLFGGTSRWRG